MTLTAQLSADMRARSSWMPMCPICTVIGVADMPGQLRGPSWREVKLPASSTRPKPVVVWKIDRCCALSDTTERFDSASQAASWWRARRQQPLACVADENRRRNVLAKLQAKDLEAVE